MVTINARYYHFAIVGERIYVRDRRVFVIGHESGSHRMKPNGVYHVQIVDVHWSLQSRRSFEKKWPTATARRQDCMVDAATYQRRMHEILWQKLMRFSDNRILSP